jgi:hypothetical protein
VFQLFHRQNTMLTHGKSNCQPNTRCRKDPPPPQRVRCFKCTTVNWGCPIEPAVSF